MFLMKGTKWKETSKHCMLREKYGKVLIGIQFVRFFIVWKMTKKLILRIFKSLKDNFPQCKNVVNMTWSFELKFVHD